LTFGFLFSNNDPFDIYEILEGLLRFFYISTLKSGYFKKEIITNTTYYIITRILIS